MPCDDDVWAASKLVPNAWNNVRSLATEETKKARDTRVRTFWIFDSARWAAYCRKLPLWLPVPGSTCPRECSCNYCGHHPPNGSYRARSKARGQSRFFVVPPCFVSFVPAFSFDLFVDRKKKRKKKQENGRKFKACHALPETGFDFPRSLLFRNVIIDYYRRHARTSVSTFHPETMLLK